MFRGYTHSLGIRYPWNSTAWLVPFELVVVLPLYGTVVPFWYTDELPFGPTSMMGISGQVGWGRKEPYSPASQRAEVHQRQLRISGYEGSF
jgi:hypothetical protein